MMGVGERAIATVAWSGLEVLRGTGEDLAGALLALLRSPDRAEAQRTWWNIENVVFSQDTIYGAAVATVDVVLAALVDDRPFHVRSWLIELLRFLLKGGSLDDPTLATRIHERARFGLWLLVREATAVDGHAREAVLEVIDLIEPGQGSEIRRWLS